jgi:hypothetical protein
MNQAQTRFPGLRSFFCLRPSSFPTPSGSAHRGRDGEWCTAPRGGSVRSFGQRAGGDPSGVRDPPQTEQSVARCPLREDLDGHIEWEKPAAWGRAHDGIDTNFDAMTVRRAQVPHPAANRLVQAGFLIGFAKRKILVYYAHRCSPPLQPPFQKLD